MWGRLCQVIWILYTVRQYATSVWFASGTSLSSAHAPPSIFVTVTTEFGNRQLEAAAVGLRHSLSKLTAHIHKVDQREEDARLLVGDLAG
jgi:hypothetical protein